MDAGVAGPVLADGYPIRPPQAACVCLLTSCRLALQRAQAAIDEDAAKLIESTEQEMACLQTLGQAELQKLAQQMASKMAFIKKLQDECQQVCLLLSLSLPDHALHSGYQDLKHKSSLCPAM